MANIFENQERHVIPGWRSFKKTVGLGELNSFSKKSPAIVSKHVIESYVVDWQNHQTIAHAGDLLSAAFVNGVTKDPSVINAATFVLKSDQNVPQSQLSLAKNILRDEVHQTALERLNGVTLADFETLVNPKLNWDKVKFLKREIRKYPFNSILYVDLSRQYSILGQGEKAMQSMRIALGLSPENRFILRSAARLFAHYDDAEYAHDILRKSRLTSVDPWLAASEIAIASLRGRTSKYLKKSLEMINSKNVSPVNLTELASSIGTIELINGSLKKSRDLFQTSLVEPNDNSLAQFEWASSKERRLAMDVSNHHVHHNFEALALENFHNQDHAESINNVFRWFLDMPFSKRPVMLGSHIASSYLDDQETSRAFLKAGLISHPNDAQLINNLVYSLALENKTDEALKYIQNVPDNIPGEPITSICLKATRGLICFRKGLPDMGRSYYLEAIEQSKAENSKYYNWLAILNYAREELLIKSPESSEVMKYVALLQDDQLSPDLAKLKSEVVDLHQRANQSRNL